MFSQTAKLRGFVGALVLIALSVTSGQAQIPSPVRLAAGASAPAFRLPDTAGKFHTLGAMRGHPMIVFFFCGCATCHAAAAMWEGAVESEKPIPTTWAVFSGDANDAKAFAAQTGLGRSSALYLTDPNDIVGGRYGVSLCPRVFVLDAKGRIRYTNNAPGADPQTMPAATLVSQVLSAWRGTQKR